MRYHSSVPEPALSIVIPTHRRAEILQQCLWHIEEQTIYDQIEVIVVSDGEDAATAKLFADNVFQVPVTFFSVPKSQQGVARNYGVGKANAPVTLFLGDDMFLDPDACEKHLEIHEESGGRPRSVLGRIDWDPKAGITDAMLWLDRTGWQFGYGFLSEFEHRELPRNIQHRFSYTGNISLPTALAKRFPFREDASLYGWEDIEWGWRLAEAGIPLFYEPDAKMLHHHQVTLEDSLKRMETLGQSAVLFDSVNPQLGILPKGWKLLLYRVGALFSTMRGRHMRAFLRGRDEEVIAGRSGAA